MATSNSTDSPTAETPPPAAGVVVTRVVARRENPHRVDVIADGEVVATITADEAVRRELRPGLALSASEVRTLRRLTDLGAARDRAFRLLAVRPRSRAELEARLTRAGVDQETVTTLLDDLTAKGYLDDAAFAAQWVENRAAHRPKGRVALAAELRAKGVAEDEIQAAVAPVADQEVAAALALAKRRAAGLHGLDVVTQRRRLSAFLQRRGYPAEVVGAAVRQALATS